MNFPHQKRSRNFVIKSAYEMKFSPTFLFQNIELSLNDPLIRNFRVWASDKRVRISFQASKLANSS